MSTYYTPEEVATELRVTRRTVYEWLRTGRLHGLRAGKAWRIPAESVAAFLGADGNGYVAASSVAPVVENGSREAASAEADRRREKRKPRVIDAEQARKNQAAIELLRKWRTEGDAEEQRETWEYLKRVLDEDRPSYRKLFP
jgi:excisionase family DNA binding protein